MSAKRLKRELAEWRKLAEELGDCLDYCYPNTDVLDKLSEMQSRG